MEVWLFGRNKWLVCQYIVWYHHCSTKRGSIYVHFNDKKWNQPFDLRWPILFLLVPTKRFAWMVEVSYLYNILYHTSLFSIACCLSDLYPLSDDLTTDGQFYMTLKRSHCFFWAKGGVVVRARASHQSSLDSRPVVDAISGLSLLLARGVTWVNFAGYVPLASGSPYPIIVYSVANYRSHSHFWANM